MIDRRTFTAAALASPLALLLSSGARAEGDEPTLAQLLQSIEHDLATACELVGTSLGPLDPVTLTQVEPLLEGVLQDLTAIAEAEEFTDVESGTVHSIYSAPNLPKVAATVVSLARSCHRENERRGTNWQQRLFNHVATIESLITRPETGYLDRAGITIT